MIKPEKESLGILKNTVDNWRYTLLVIELWHAARERKPKLNLSKIGEGDSVNGVHEVQMIANAFIASEDSALAIGYAWNNNYYDATEEFADKISRLWARGVSLQVGEISSVISKILKKHMLPPGKRKGSE